LSIFQVKENMYSSSDLQTDFSIDTSVKYRPYLLTPGMHAIYFEMCCIVQLVLDRAVKSVVHHEFLTALL
jgi:hypothetical protein